MTRKVLYYSEAFKRGVVEDLEKGKFKSFSEVQRAYGIKGSTTVSSWARRYGNEELLPKKVRIETMKERDELKEAKKRIRELEAALSDAHVDHVLEKAYLHVACDRIGMDLEDFKKKNAMTLSELRKKPRKGLR